MENRSRPWVILGGILMGASAVAPWLGDLLASQWGFSVPVALAFDLETTATAPPIAVVLLSAAVVTLIAASVRWAWPVRQAAGAIVVLLTVAVGVQVVRFSMEIDAGYLSVLNPLGAGAYLALAGGLLALLAPVPERVQAPHGLPGRAAPPVASPPAGAPPIHQTPQAVAAPFEQAPSPPTTGEIPAAAAAAEPAVGPAAGPAPEQPAAETPTPEIEAAAPVEREQATDADKAAEAVGPAEGPEATAEDSGDQDGEERPGDEPA